MSGARCMACRCAALSLSGASESQAESAFSARFIEYVNAYSNSCLGTLRSYPVSTFLARLIPIERSSLSGGTVQINDS
jgi:hypothetical protein